MNIFDQISIKIIEGQELIIGPIAWREAGQVQGIHVDEKAHTLHIDNGDEKLVVDKLVSQYEHLFGRASREVCKEAAASLLVGLSPAEIPSSLR